MTGPTTEHVHLERRGAVAVLTFDRPAVKNAFTLEMMDACARLVRDVDADPEIGALVVTGAGDSFCSGIELGALAAVENHPVAHKRMLIDHVHQVLHALEACETPVIAAINGAAVGAGLDMALACDLRIAALTARASEGYIRVGLVPGDGGCYLLPPLVGLGRALELLMTGRFVDAEEAERIGMVNRVVDADELMPVALELAARLAALPTTQLGMIKRAARSSARMDLRTHLDLMSSHLGVAMATPEVQDLLGRSRPA
ncbi:enoyl-CoA hydratase/isomerase family protein [Nocardioides sediminis]|uniref:enoyl-CoA hydratase/isomerase family protein n=1 Tax=Nocardioides sediminis TaxID=433648 RepID=UPI000D30BFD5|nr:enoyl-CoA hydratase/isomerase family protein [Nocardioides sediminis]